MIEKSKMLVQFTEADIILGKFLSACWDNYKLADAYPNKEQREKLTAKIEQALCESNHEELIIEIFDDHIRNCESEMAAMAKEFSHQDFDYGRNMGEYSFCFDDAAFNKLI